MFTHGTERYAVNDTKLSNWSYESIDATQYSTIETLVKDNIKSLIDEGGLCTHGGADADRRVFAVVTGCHKATVSVDLKPGSGELKTIGDGIIGVRMLCFKMRRMEAADMKDQWQLSRGIPIVSGRLPIELKDAIVWTCRPLHKRLVM